MDSKTVKKFIKGNLNVEARVTTTQTKNRWITAWISSEQGSFPPEFRQKCIKAVYPNSPNLHTQTAAGNIAANSIAMRPMEWAKVIEANAE